MKYDFDMITLGGGAAGLGIAGISANLGARVCLIESGKMGGDCTWTGCIPSKTLLKASKVAHQIRTAGKYGLTDSNPVIDFQRVMNHVDAVRTEVYEDADSPEIFEAMGVDIKFGRGRFVNTHTIEIRGEDGSIETISGRYISISTGSKPLIPTIPGLDTIPYLTNESLFEIDELPEQLVVIGAGPIGIEMAQAFSRLGSKVIVLEKAERILPRDNAELANELCGFLQEDGIRFLLKADIQRISQNQSGVCRAEVRHAGKSMVREADRVLVATGRRPNVDGLGLDTVGVRYSASGVEVNARCRTSRPHIFAAGDVLGQAPFTHMAEQTAKVVVSNALLKIPTRVDHRHIPWTTFTDPEIAHLGASESDLLRAGKPFETYRFPYTKIDRAIADGDTRGRIKVYATKGRGMILGVDILGARAGDLIGEFALAMRNGISLRRFSDTIHPYPTYSLGARRAADQWYVRKQAAWQVKLLQKIFRYRGQVPDLSDPDRIV